MENARARQLVAGTKPNPAVNRALRDNAAPHGASTYRHVGD